MPFDFSEDLDKKTVMHGRLHVLMGWIIKIMVHDLLVHYNKDVQPLTIIEDFELD